MLTVDDVLPSTEAAAAGQSSTWGPSRDSDYVHAYRHLRYVLDRILAARAGAMGPEERVYVRAGPHVHQTGVIAALRWDAEDHAVTRPSHAVLHADPHHPPRSVELADVIRCPDWGKVVVVAPGDPIPDTWTRAVLVLTPQNPDDRTWARGLIEHLSRRRQDVDTWDTDRLVVFYSEESQHDHDDARLRTCADVIVQPSDGADEPTDPRVLVRNGPSHTPQQAADQVVRRLAGGSSTRSRSGALRWLSPPISAEPLTRQWHAAVERRGHTSVDIDVEWESRDEAAWVARVEVHERAVTHEELVVRVPDHRSVVVMHRPALSDWLDCAILLQRDTRSTALPPPVVQTPSAAIEHIPHLRSLPASPVDEDEAVRWYDEFFSGFGVHPIRQSSLMHGQDHSGILSHHTIDVFTLPRREDRQPFWALNEDPQSPYEMRTILAILRNRGLVDFSTLGILVNACDRVQRFS